MCKDDNALLWRIDVLMFDVVSSIKIFCLKRLIDDSTRSIVIRLLSDLSREVVATWRLTVRGPRTYVTGGFKNITVLYVYIVTWFWLIDSSIVDWLIRWLFIRFIVEYDCWNQLWFSTVAGQWIFQTSTQDERENNNPLFWLNNHALLVQYRGTNSINKNYVHDKYPRPWTIGWNRGLI